MPNDVINTRSVRFHAPNTTIQSQSSQVRRATPPAQPRPVSRNRNLQVPRVPNILNNSLPVIRTKSTRSTRKKIKGYKDTQSQGKKRKTKVNVAKKSKSASQKKRGRKMSRRVGGGDDGAVCTFRSHLGRELNSKQIGDHCKCKDGSDGIWTLCSDKETRKSKHTNGVNKLKRDIGCIKKGLKEGILSVLGTKTDCSK